MAPYVVLFEDHTWKSFAPIAASQPTYEQRCGLFRTRERIELAGAGGTLLCRAVLEALQPAGTWSVGPDALASLDDGGQGRQLWIAGRLAPRQALVSGLLDLAQDAPDFAWYDDQGMLAALLSAAEARAALLSWLQWRGAAAGSWGGAQFVGGSMSIEPAPGQRLDLPAGGPSGRAENLADVLGSAAGNRPPALRWLWDVVSATGEALASDLGAGIRAGGWRRLPFGIVAKDALEAPCCALVKPKLVDAGGLPVGVHMMGEGLWCGSKVELAPGVVVDARRGPVVLDNACVIAPQVFLEGPLYLGCGTRVKAGARLYGESSFGIGNRLGGEIGESTFGDFSNKQHEGFIGHAVCGSWVNLGALTTCSDLKNNYGPVRVDLGDGPRDTGCRFVGALLGDHVKTAIGTLLNTGTSVGFGTNIFGSGMPPKYVPPFRWGGSEGCATYDVDQAIATAEVVMSRRGCRLDSRHGDLFRAIAAGG